MSGMRDDLDKLRTLGRKTEAPKDYDPTVLETFGNAHGERDYWVVFTAPEFTTLCPKTGQPDFATLTIRYIPDRRLVESKSLKLYLFSFRNHGDFHEDVVNVVFGDLWQLLRPKYLEVCGKFAARGGISIDPFVNEGRGAKYVQLAARRFADWPGVRAERG
ncbi:MAG: preQ(1) synthase [Kiritimatiellae bacterium]|nr:preQ(1) synthase [Kiritimatiellia bacterium]